VKHNSLTTFLMGSIANVVLPFDSIKTCAQALGSVGRIFHKYLLG
jgi:hypothetical protein